MFELKYIQFSITDTNVIWALYRGTAYWYMLSYSEKFLYSSDIEWSDIRDGFNDGTLKEIDIGKYSEALKAWEDLKACLS